MQGFAQGKSGSLPRYLPFSCPQDKTPQVSEMETQNETSLEFSDSSLVAVTLASSNKQLQIHPHHGSPRPALLSGWCCVLLSKCTFPSLGLRLLALLGRRLLQGPKEIQHTRGLAQGSIVRLCPLPSQFPCLPVLSPQTPLPSWGPGSLACIICIDMRPHPLGKFPLVTRLPF